MIPFYWKSPAGNFGDDLNDWLWDDLLPGFRTWEHPNWLIGVGTVLNAKLLPDPASYLVIGSGTGIGTLPTPNNSWDIRCVRGPNTARLLGLPARSGIIDPAALISRMPAFANVKKTGRTLFIPHCHSAVRADYDWPSICSASGVDYQSPCEDARTVIAAIAAADRVISESMHGAIIADAFRVPWRPVSMVHNFNDFKWRDWGASLELSFDITPMPKPLQTIRDKTKFLRSTKRPAHSGNAQISAPVASSASASNRTLGARTVVKRAAHRFQAAITVRKLADLAAQDFYLSRSEVLNARLDQLEEVLHKIAGDYQ